MNLDWKIWALGGAGLLAAFMLLRNQGSTSKQQVDTTDTNPADMTTPVGQSYSYLDGSGVQHLTATDPNGNLTSYSYLPQGTGDPQTGQLASYVGMMGNVGYVQPYGFTTPYYSQNPYYNVSPN